MQYRPALKIFKGALKTLGRYLDQASTRNNRILESKEAYLQELKVGQWRFSEIQRPGPRGGSPRKLGS